MAPNLYVEESLVMVLYLLYVCTKEFLLGLVVAYMLVHHSSSVSDHITASETRGSS